MTTPTHFAYVYHGKGDDQFLAYVRPSVMRGMILCRVERKVHAASGLLRRPGPIRLLHKREAAICRAATCMDLDEVERLVGLLVKAGMSEAQIREAVPV